MSENKPLLGAHQSIAGGVEKSLARGQEVGCDTIQIFVKTPNRWVSKALAEENIVAFKEAVAETGIWPVFAHSLYLINLATPDDALWQKSLDALTDDLERCELLGLPGLVIHPGSHVGSGEEAGIARISSAVRGRCSSSSMVGLLFRSGSPPLPGSRPVPSGRSAPSPPRHRMRHGPRFR